MQAVAADGPRRRPAPSGLRGGATAGLAGLLLVAASPAAALLTVDDFEQGAQALCLAPAADCAPADTGSALASQTAPATTALGGERDLLLSRVSGTGGARVGVDDGNQGQLSFQVDVNTEAEVAMVWDGMDADADAVASAGLGTLDLFADGHGAFRLLVSSPVPVPMALRVYDAGDPNAMTWSEVAFSAPASGTQEPGMFSAFDVLFTAFDSPDAQGTGGPADLARAGAIELRIMGAASEDVLIDSVQVVPEPAAGGVAALLVLGALALRSRRR